MSVDSHIDHVDWPAELRSYAEGAGLKFASRGAHPFVWVAVPFGLALGALGVAGIAGLGTSGLVSIIVGAAAVAFAVSVLLSAAYAAWGVLVLERRGGEWVVTRRLGPLRSVSTFGTGPIRSADVWSPPPYVVLWPGCAGRHVRVHVSDRERSIAITAGLRLDGATLQALCAVFTSNR
jgi:hypothetical protein